MNIEWCQVLAKRSSNRKDWPVFFYCDTGSLSAQAGFVLRIAGYESQRTLPLWVAGAAADALN